MDIERLARKLEPLAPARVQRWRRSREFADSETRTLLDKQLLLLAHQLLGDDLSQPLLSLPPRRIVSGSIRLGTVLYDKAYWPAGLTHSGILQHSALLGRSGSGKTNALLHILRQLDVRGVPFLVVDFKQTMRHALSFFKHPPRVYTVGRELLPFPFNPFNSPPGVQREEYIHHVIDVLSSAFTLGDGARSVVRKAVLAAYDHAAPEQPPSLDDIITAIEQIPDNVRSRGWKASALRAMESLSFIFPAGHSAERRKNDVAHELLARSTVLEVDALAPSAVRFLVPLLLFSLYTSLLRSNVRERLRICIVLEEAHNLIHRQTASVKETLLEMLFRQAREFGMGFIVVDQHPSQLSTAVLNNIYTTMCFSQRDPRDLKAAARLSQLDEADEACLADLPVGQAVARLSGGYTKPFLVQIPHVSVAKGSVSDSALVALQAGKRSHSGRLFRRWQSVQGIPQLPLSDDVFSPAAMRFLDDVLEHPGSGVRERYLRLGLSAGRGSRLKTSLVAQGWLDSLTVPAGNTRKVVLRLSRQAKKALGIDETRQRNESLEHEYWKHRIAEEYREKGYSVTVEAPRVGGRVDVLAEKDGKRIGIEVETGKSDVVRNVKNCLRSAFDRVVLVGTTGTAATQVEEKLAEAGLLTAERLMLVCDSNSRDRHSARRDVMGFS